MQRIDTINLLEQHRSHHPVLRSEENNARLMLAEAILQLDKEDLANDGSDQAALRVIAAEEHLSVMQHRYRRALANLLRGRSQ